MHHFPGFDVKSPTSLPHGLTADGILKRVAEAQASLKRKVSFMIMGTLNGW
jgi:hypothetical protein